MSVCAIIGALRYYAKAASKAYIKIYYMIVFVNNIHRGDIGFLCNDLMKNVLRQHICLELIYTFFLHVCMWV